MRLVEGDMGENLGSSWDRSRDMTFPGWCATVAALSLVGSATASAAPIKVACIGEQTTHSHAFPPLDRESAPVGMQEYPAMLQTMLGPGYDVRNFGDCCGSVLQGYMVQETHPYVLGSNPGEGPGYKESIAFLPDVVVIGSWGRHDWGKAKAAAEVWDLARFQRDYDDLVQRYLTLASHPRIYISLPIPIPFGTDGPDNGVFTSDVVDVIKAVAVKYALPIVDLHAPFLGHKELYKQPPDREGEGEHVTNDGLHLIATTVYAAIAAGEGGSDAAASDSAPGPATLPGVNRSGCGCRLGAPGARSPGFALALLALLIALPGRRRRAILRP
jgi:sialate O-acetylesterase